MISAAAFLKFFISTKSCEFVEALIPSLIPAAMTHLVPYMRLPAGVWLDILG
jgi:hypothetical protein